MWINITSFFLVGFLWGGSFVAIRIALAAYPPFFSAGIRLAIASLIFLIYCGGKTIAHTNRRDFLRISLAGFFALALPFFLLFWGEQHISAGLGGILNGTVTVWSFVISALFFNKKNEFTFHKITGLLIGLVGIVFIFGPRIQLQGTSKEFWGTLAVLGMAISYGLGGNLSKVLFSGKDPVNFRANLFYQHAVSAALLLVASFAFESWPTPKQVVSNGVATTSLLYLGVASSALAFFLFYRLLKEWGAVKASSICYVVPVAAIFWDFVIFKNVPQFHDLIGAAIILSGVGLIQKSN